MVDNLYDILVYFCMLLCVAFISNNNNDESRKSPFAFGPIFGLYSMLFCVDYSMKFSFDSTKFSFDLSG